ncbi:MAG: glycoside hydrolase [Candidatus Micrarchaeota archaeon]
MAGKQKQGAEQKLATAKAIYVPWLHMHQPHIWFVYPKNILNPKRWENESLIGNLEKMLYEGNYDANKFAMAYANPAKFVTRLREEGFDPKIMLDFSGTLLESLERLSQSDDFNNMYVRVDMAGRDEQVGNIIEQYKNALAKYPDAIEFTGTGFYHPYFPAIPRADWASQISRWREKFKSLFGEKALLNVKGFWLPEMGIPGDEGDLFHLIREIKKAGYKWMILPAVENPQACPLELPNGEWNRFRIFNEPHILSASLGGETESIVAVVREPGIDHQSGCGAGGVYDKANWVARERAALKASVSPALLVPTSDGENGNVMMNQFFFDSFTPFYTNIIDDKVSSLCVSDYLEGMLKKKLGKVDWARAEEIFSPIKIKKKGGSWIGGHQQWLEGDRRLAIKRKIDALSERLHKFDKSKGTQAYREAEDAVLNSETSCYVYWGSDFWFDQGEVSLKYAEKKIYGLGKP